MTKSASDTPGIIEPFWGYSPYSFAAFVDVTSTNLVGSNLFAEKANGIRVSIPGKPLGMYLKRPTGCSLVTHVFFPISTSSKRNGQWSELRIENVPFLSPVQIAWWSSAFLGGGEHTHLAPSKPGLSRSSRVRKRYCGPVHESHY